MELMNHMSLPVYESLIEKGHAKLAEMYRKCYASTWETTLEQSDGTVFLITGDIPAMWLRDSSAQVYHYLKHADSIPEIKEAISGLLRRQFQYICLDPYANAFNREANGQHYRDDHTSWTPAQKPWIWENKYEIDSLCYPVRLAYRFWKKTGDSGIFDAGFVQAAQTILKVFETEQHHAERSAYFYERTQCPPTDTLPCGGKGTPVAYTGMTWSGFRPSDDACRYGYLVPSNFFAACELGHLCEIAEGPLADAALASHARMLKEQIENGLRQHSIVRHPKFGEVYAYEVDGFGNFILMDDANVPSLLSLPYLGCLSADDPVYLNTRKMLLSPENPYYYEGTALKGIGSPHTPKPFVWPISLCIQGLTSNDPDEVRS
ncbi:MAG: glycoside hydrolase family 125 protein, partial [Clostridia bacterium]|nr:glycoside hydrolase family 125 protein [Clostridia bacterium]